MTRVAALVALATTAVVHGAQPLTIMAPAAPGGGWDQTARALQHVLSIVEPGASVQVDNVAGAAGTIGLARFVRAERGNPDALLVTGLVMVSAIIMNHSSVTLSETTPIARLTGEPEVIVVPAASPIRTFQDLLATFRTSPATVAWGGGSAGGTDDLLVRLIAEATGVPPSSANYIAFPGGGAALAALLGGQVTAGVSGYGEFAGQIEAGALRALAISSARRVPGIDVRTLIEQGVNLDLSNWRGVVAPPGLTDVERDAVIARVERLARSAAWRGVLERNGWEDTLLTGPAFRQFLLVEQGRVESVLRRLAVDAPASRDAGWFTLTRYSAPAVVLVGLGLLVVMLAWRGRTQKRAIGPTPFRSGTQNRELDPTPLWKSRPAGLTAALVGHAIAFPVVGFIPASTALFVVVAALFGSTHRGRDVGIGLTAAVLLYLVFSVGLGVVLPLDPVTRWFGG